MKVFENDYMVLVAYLVGMFVATVAGYVVRRTYRWWKCRRLLNGGEWAQEADVPYGKKQKTPDEAAQDELQRLRDEGVIVKTEVVTATNTEIYKEPDLKKGVWLASVPMSELDDKLINNIVRSLKERPEEWEFCEHWAKHTESKLKIWCRPEHMPNHMSMHYGTRDRVDLKNKAHRNMLWDAMRERAVEAYNAAQRKKGLGERNAIEAAQKAFGGEA